VRHPARFRRTAQASAAAPVEQLSNDGRTDDSPSLAKAELWRAD
jgi:hypothetical protein